MKTYTATWDPPTLEKLKEICDVLGITAHDLDDGQGIIVYPNPGADTFCADWINPGDTITTWWDEDGEVRSVDAGVGPLYEPPRGRMVKMWFSGLAAT